MGKPWITQAEILRLLGRSASRLNAADLCLRDAVLDRVGRGVGFSAAEIYEPLDAVLRTCGVIDVNALGRRLRKISRHDTSLVRVGRDASGTIWCFLPDAE